MLFRSDPQLTYLKAAIQRADSGVVAASTLQAALQNIGLNATVFAPTDDAFKTFLTTAVAQYLISQGFPAATAHFKHVVVILAVIGVVYASCIAMMQDNLKKLVAYSSIAHIGLMCAAIFSLNQVSVQGALMQMFNHGINIIGMWVVIDIIERRTGVKKISELSGLAHSAPVLTILFIIIAFANIALPLTNAFTGEFLMFSGVYNYNHWMSAIAGLGVILSAVYTLNMIQKVFYGSVNQLTTEVKDITWNEKLSLYVIVGIIFFMGVYPQPLIELTKEAVNNLIVRVQ